MNQFESFRDVLSSMKHWRPMLALLDDLSSKPESVTDARIEEVWHVYKQSIQTNCEGAAEALMAALSSICARRPEMLDKLLADAIEPLFMLGVEAPEALLVWADAYIGHNESYMGRPDEQALKWIRETFLLSGDAIQLVWDRLMETED
ncbi:hypothetical protein D8Y20_00235 [Mariprofundus sp. EBB-1]|uniref:hypothetical protein n=1 Tax=Mariprofundus sp. EBB-1 TaxID=2650971 RepID=UPI000EF25F11|nr:hypothetical protein [Mariprofundus sp. EBB-1]RLL55912.1 hypothetical protein D8Y20_00235 [Mariprofundus sp. EBB-1]